MENRTELFWLWFEVTTTKIGWNFVQILIELHLQLNKGQEFRSRINSLQTKWKKSNNERILFCEADLFVVLINQGKTSVAYSIGGAGEYPGETKKQGEMCKNSLAMWGARPDTEPQKIIIIIGVSIIGKWKYFKNVPKIFEPLAKMPPFPSIPGDHFWNLRNPDGYSAPDPKLLAPHQMDFNSTRKNFWCYYIVAMHTMDA